MHLFSLFLGPALLALSNIYCGSYIGRHGARLDAVNPQWHLTSATPYDPPLTYGGWKQSLALGARIGSILHSREAAIDSIALSKELSTATLGHAPIEPGGQCVPQLSQRKCRKQRLIIHTSPFLRCIETSIGISAGVEQYQGSQNSKPPSTSQKPHSQQQSIHSESSYLQRREHRKSSFLSAIPEPDDIHAEKSADSGSRLCDPPKNRLRLDAFLGEWLSPEYFEMITPPPDSKMMVAGAKAALLRLKQTEILHNVAGPSLSRGNFPGGWGSNQLMVNGFTRGSKNEPITDLSHLGHSLLESGQSNSSHSDPRHPQKIDSQQGPQSEDVSTSSHGGYTPLQPTFATSLLDGIPAGYVAHARDACVDIDYRWDSMRPPHDWGDGGIVGEEWSSMHRRFRRGLQSMITWYRTGSTAERKADPKGEVADEDEAGLEDEAEMETVLVLVTHGAGCNALIGALTNQPVLLDVGMASLTMAVRKSQTDSRQGSSDVRSAVITRRHLTIDSGVSEDYEVKMIASTDHLRIPRHPSGTSSRSYRPSTAPPRAHAPLLSRHHSGSVGSNTPRNTTMLDVTFSLGEDAHLQSNNNNSFTPNPPGLWSMPVALMARKATLPLRSGASESRQESRATPTIPYSHSHPRPGENHHEAEQNSVFGLDDHLEPFARPSQHGLWGSSPPPRALGTMRDKGTKRRWTHSEHL